MERTYFAENLNFLIEQRDIKKEQVAELSGLSRSFVYSITQSTGPVNSSVNKIAAIAGVFSIPLFVFFLPPTTFQKVVVKLPKSSKKRISLDDIIKTLTSISD